jgi:pyruvate dehydrogenase E1 component alpha subunit
VDGNDILAAHAAVAAACDHIRSGAGPYFLEFKTWRWQGIFAGEFRPAEEVSYWKDERDPIKLAGAELLDRGVDAGTLRSLESDVDAQIESWIDFAKASPAPDPAKATANVYVGWEVAAR